ncbi:MAG: aldo/keto reductase [Propionibacteriaceae bacterium]|nr:aldo/keto reductase [Propionibacteriaceae bacterium]
MRTAFVGSSTLRVSQLGLGTMSWGGRTTASEASDMLKAFAHAGGTLIDTAAAYGNGDVESLLGRLMRQDVPRRELVLATKSGFVVKRDQRVVDNSRSTLLKDLEGSLDRLGTDHVDLWQVHAWGEEPLEETLSALDEAVSRGMAAHVGVSNFVGWQVAEAETWQRARGNTPLISAQGEYSMLARSAELELLPCLNQLQVGFFAWSALGRGVLSGKYANSIPAGSRGDDSSLAWFVEQYADEGSRRIVEALMVAARGLGLTAAQVALSWLCDSPHVTSALIGPRNLDQLQPLLSIDDIVLPEPIISALDDVTGGPRIYRLES